jgi:hypothetical protein
MGSKTSIENESISAHLILNGAKKTGFLLSSLSTLVQDGKDLRNIYKLLRINDEKTRDVITHLHAVRVYADWTCCRKRRASLWDNPPFKITG